LKLLRIIRTLNPSGGGQIEGVRQITPHLEELLWTELAGLEAVVAKAHLRLGPYHRIT